MNHIKVRWIHDHPDEPVLLYSELDEARWELRKVEVFRDGSIGFADRTEEVGGSGLSIEQLPDLEEISKQPQFELTEIGLDEFEHIWAARREANNGR